MPDIATGRNAAQILLSHHPEIDAILAFNDIVAVGVIHAYKVAGL
jgi:ABC-type sugar transport system substrate-binding protein